jgi:predicted acylesterase/phospholipase RssA
MPRHAARRPRTQSSTSRTKDASAFVPDVHESDSEFSVPFPGAASIGEDTHMATNTGSDDEQEDQRLRLQRMETKLVRGLFDHPGVVSRAREHQLRYSIALASLDVFQPGAARRGGRTRHPDVRVRSPRLSRWRSLILDELGPILLQIEDSKERVEEASAFLGPRLARMEKTRAEILEKYVDDFSARHLDQELGIKTLVSIAGGGGGSGYVYIGAWDVLQAAGLVPGYVIGASMGSVLGLFRARDKVGDFDEYLRLAKGMRAEDIFRFVSLRTRFGFPGMARLFLHEGIGQAFTHEDGQEMCLPDLEIPYDAVVAGVRRGALDESPEQYAMSHHLHEDKRPLPLQMRAQVALQLVRLTGFINPRVVKEIVVGRDELTRDFNAIDAAGFSAAIPGLLHYDMTRDDPRMETLLTQLMERDDVVALVDGGVANNVPAGPAWRQVQEGRIGTRNAYYLAFDSFHPQGGVGHLWLQPLTRVVALQVATNERYAHRRIEFKPTLSPIRLLPAPAQLDRAVKWGRTQMAEELPLLHKFFERVRWVPPTDSE